MLRTCVEYAALRADDAAESNIVQGLAHAPNIAAQGVKSRMRLRLRAMHVLNKELSMAWARKGVHARITTLQPRN